MKTTGLTAGLLGTKGFGPETWKVLECTGKNKCLSASFVDQKSIRLSIYRRLINSAVNSTIYREGILMTNEITANDLKTRGISAIDELSEKTDGVIITVRGKQKYIVLPIDEYNQLREYELEAAIAETKKDIAEGRFHEDSVEEHMKRISGSV